MTEEIAAKVMPELLPCPFCGGEAMHLHTKVKSNFNNHLMDYDVVDCKNCRASTRSYCDNKDGAIAAWNTRNQSGSVAGLVEALSGILEIPSVTALMSYERKKQAKEALAAYRKENGHE